MVLKTIETIGTIFKLAGETKPQEKKRKKKNARKKINLKQKNNQRIVPIVSIVFKKTTGAEIRI